MCIATSLMQGVQLHNGLGSGAPGLAHLRALISLLLDAPAIDTADNDW
jgi:hypothetical protein